MRYRTDILFVGAFAALAACSGSDTPPSITAPSPSKPAILDILGVLKARAFTEPGTDNPYALYSLSDGSALVAFTISHLYILKP